MPIAAVPPAQIERLAARPQALETFVASLPAAMRSKYALVYQTRNLIQPASLEAPRMLLFNEDSSVVLAIAPGHSTVEMMNYQGGEFVFKTLDTATGHIDHEPKTCFGCHAGRPIWDSYPDWAGVFGSDSGARTHEHAAFQEFLSKGVEGRVYESLVGLHSVALNEEHAAFGQNSLLTMNEQVTEEMGSLNMQRIFAQLTRHPDYETYRFALFAAINGDESFLSYLPGAHRAEWLDYEARARRRLEVHRQRTIERSRVLGDETFYPKSFDLEPDTFSISSKLGYVMAKMGLSLERDAMMFPAGPLSFTTPLQGISTLRIALKRDFGRAFPDLKRRLQIGRLSKTDKYTAPLASREIADLFARAGTLRCESVFTPQK